jgi:hypothetical protein
VVHFLLLYFVVVLLEYEQRTNDEYLLFIPSFVYAFAIASYNDYHQNYQNVVILIPYILHCVIQTLIPYGIVISHLQLILENDTDFGAGEFVTRVRLKKN